SEQAALLSSSDWELAACFNNIHKALTDHQYNTVFADARHIRTIYPEADLYSNLSFLEGYAFERLGLPDQAIHSYTFYLTHSTGTFSKRQRGYDQADAGDSLLMLQRTHAKKFVSTRAEDSTLRFSPIPPKLYTDPYQPGFSLTGTRLTDPATHFPFLIGKDLSGKLSYGGQLFIPFNRKSLLYAQTLFSKDMARLTVGFPMQLVQSSDLRVGVKVTPFISYAEIDNLTTSKGRFEVDQGYADFGARLSAGYYLQPNLALGAYYQYDYHHSGNKFRTRSGVEIWDENEVDLSVYYNLVEGISLKMGIKNKDAVIGLFLSGWELSYSLNHHDIIIRTNLF
ncbi:MAG: hypothetical protein Q8914_13535, partial [Bacteroidota bacterium]|nr:hypothetical protein [Bacteroidota bacterium]